MSIKIKKDNMIYNDPNAVIDPKAGTDPNTVNNTKVITDPNAPVSTVGGSAGKSLSAITTGGSGVITNKSQQVPTHLNAANALMTNDPTANNIV